MQWLLTPYNTVAPGYPAFLIELFEGIVDERNMLTVFFRFSLYDCMSKLDLYKGSICIDTAYLKVLTKSPAAAYALIDAQIHEKDLLPDTKKASDLYFTHRNNLRNYMLSQYFN